MKKFVKTLLVMLTFVTSMFFVTGCFGGGVSGKTYIVVKAEVKSNNPANQEMLEMYNYILEGEVGETIVFEKGGDFGDAGTLRMIATVYLNTWSQSGDNIIINGGSDVPAPSKGYIDGDQVVIEVGNINGLLFVYTFEEVTAE